MHRTGSRAGATHYCNCTRPRQRLYSQPMRKSIALCRQVLVESLPGCGAPSVCDYAPTAFSVESGGGCVAWWRCLYNRVWGCPGIFRIFGLGSPYHYISAGPSSKRGVTLAWTLAPIGCLPVSGGSYPLQWQFLNRDLSACFSLPSPLSGIFRFATGSFATLFFAAALSLLYEGIVDFQLSRVLQDCR